MKAGNLVRPTNGRGGILVSSNAVGWFEIYVRDKAREMLPECAMLEDLQSFLIQAWRQETGRE
jgi:hypothetical protein